MPGAGAAVGGALAVVAKRSEMRIAIMRSPVF
jgi:hypothetical protein